MTAAILDSLAQVQELLGRAKPGRLYAEEFEGYTCVRRSLDTPGGAGFMADEETWSLADAEAIAGAINFLRDYGPALLAMMDDHSPDAGKMADDRSAELTTAWMAGVERERDRAAEAWRPIESAPRDGRAVILAHMGGKPYIGKWCHDTWVDERGLSRGPSHWRPLPAPPTEDAA